MSEGGLTFHVGDKVGALISYEVNRWEAYLEGGTDHHNGKPFSAFSIIFFAFLKSEYSASLLASSYSSFGLIFL